MLNQAKQLSKSDAKDFLKKAFASEQQLPMEKTHIHPKTDETFEQKPNRFQILSLDGGGLKGIFTASFLAGWEETEGRSVSEYFDLIAGTSTGGIIGLALGLGYSAKDILRFYLDEAERIFPQSALIGMKHYVATKYEADGLEKALATYFGDRRLGESKSRRIIPAYYPKAGGIYLFKTAHHPRLRNDYKERVVDVARATSAAPTYFKPFKGENGIELVDGGVWANNPVMLAITEALGYLEQPQSQIYALRISTTTETVSTKNLVQEGGLVPMAGSVVEFMMRGQAESARNMAEHLLGRQRFHEVNVMTAPGDYILDRPSQELVGLGRNEWRKHSSDLADKGFLNHQAHPFTPCFTN